MNLKMFEVDTLKRKISDEDLVFDCENDWINESNENTDSDINVRIVEKVPIRKNDLHNILIEDS